MPDVDSLKMDGTASIDLATSLEFDVSLTVGLDAVARDQDTLKLYKLRVATSFVDATPDSEVLYHSAILTSTATSTEWPALMCRSPTRHR